LQSREEGPQWKAEGAAGRGYILETAVSDPVILLGQTLEFLGDPFLDPIEDATRHQSKGAVHIVDGVIAAVGPAEDVRTAAPDVPIADHGRGLILPGFIDAHAHYSQTAIISSWGKRLIDWLETYTFPEEMRLADPVYAARIADRFFDLTLQNGITTASAYCTTAPTSVAAYFEEAERRGLRAVGGKVMMDRNAPEGLCDTAQSGYDDSKALLQTWHNRGRAQYAITPRFAPTSTAEQLEASGALWAEHPDCVMQTHLSEQVEEIAWVRELFPGSVDYLSVYEGFGLCGPGAVMGHSIHLTEREIRALKSTGSGVAHCPTSNTFIGSGLFDMNALKTVAGIPVGLATDVGGGSSFSMFRVMAASYEIAQLRGENLHPAQLLWLATAGSAQVLRLQDKIGTLKPGIEADLVVLDLASTPVIAQRVAEAETFWETVFPTIMLGDDRAISQVYVQGKPS